MLEDKVRCIVSWLSVWVGFFLPFPKCQLSCIPACISMQTRNLNNLFGLGSAAVQNDLHGMGRGIMF